MVRYKIGSYPAFLKILHCKIFQLSTGKVQRIVQIKSHEVLKKKQEFEKMDALSTMSGMGREWHCYHSLVRDKWELSTLLANVHVFPREGMTDRSEGFYCAQVEKHNIIICYLLWSHQESKTLCKWEMTWTSTSASSKAMSKRKEVHFVKRMNN